jgi:hypothetical protein
MIDFTFAWPWWKQLAFYLVADAVVLSYWGAVLYWYITRSSPIHYVRDVKGR